MRAAVLTGFLLLLGTPPTLAAEATEAGGRDFFTRTVRPILARHCLKCHGPDDKARQARLRLDLRDEALRPARSGKPAIVPGKPDASELVRRVFATGDDVMP